MADVQQLRNVGASLVDLVMAVKDGIDVEDVLPAQTLLTAVLNAVDDIQEDPDSAILDIIAGAAGAYAEVRRLPLEHTQP